ncbi:MAG: GNAT family N-acetyltransferase [Gemmatimonadota bacterium]
MDPRDYRADVALRDGTPATIRAIRPDDKQSLRWGFEQLSAQTIYHRFFQSKRELTDADLRYLTEVDFTSHVALVMEVEIDGVARVIGVGRFVRETDAEPRDRAEVAFTVGDEFQGRGVATHLLAHLACIARGLDYRCLVAEVMPDNRQMLEVFAHSELPITEAVRDGVVHVELGL